MTAQQQYDSLDGKQRQDLLLKIGETREEARALSQRDYNALVGQRHTAARRVCPKRFLTSASWGSVTFPQQTRVARGSTRISCCKPTRSPASRLPCFAGAFIMVVPLDPFPQ